MHHIYQHSCPIHHQPTSRQPRVAAPHSVASHVAFSRLSALQFHPGGRKHAFALALVGTLIYLLMHCYRSALALFLLSPFLLSLQQTNSCLQQLSCIDCHIPNNAELTVEEAEEQDERDGILPLQDDDLDLVVGALGMDPRVPPAVVDDFAGNVDGNDGAASAPAAPAAATAATAATVASGSAAALADAEAVDDLLQRANRLVSGCTRCSSETLCPCILCFAACMCVRLRLCL